MNRLLPNLSRAALFASLVVTLGACSPDKAPDPATATLAEAAEVRQADVPAVSVVSVKFGRYVEPKTFAIGGVATKFRSSDPLFAAVQLEGTAERANVAVRLLDPGRQPVAEQAREVQPKQTMRVNFALRQATSAVLAPGEYQAETLLDGKVVNTTPITLQ